MLAKLAELGQLEHLGLFLWEAVQEPRVLYQLAPAALVLLLSLTTSEQQVAPYPSMLMATQSEHAAALALSRAVPCTTLL